MTSSECSKYSRRDFFVLFGGTIAALAAGVPLGIKFAKEASLKKGNNPLSDTKKEETIPEVFKPAEYSKIRSQIETLPIDWMPKTVTRWSPLVNEISQKYKIDPNFLLILILCESGGNFCTVSKEGGLGLGRIKDFNAKGKNLLDPKENLEIAASYLAEQYQKFSQDWGKAFLAYHCGWGNVEKGIISEEGKKLLEFVMGMYKQAGKEGKIIYGNWLEAEGKELINRAQELYDLDSKTINALEFAAQQWHKKYLLGAEGPDQWDCARLVYFAYKSAGVTFTGSIAGGKVVTDQWLSCGRVLAENEEKLPGDLVVFNDNSGKLNHVGMMIYPPSCFIEATYTGGLVKISSLSPNYPAIYRGDLAKRVKGFKRVIG